MVNKVTLLGNLGSNPELRETSTGRAVCNFRVATNERWTSNGKKQEHTEWHQVVVWGQLAKVCGQYLEKGRQVYLEGKLRTREWKAADGSSRYTTEVVATEVNFLGGRKASQANTSKPEEPVEDFEDYRMDGDIPF